MPKIEINELYANFYIIINNMILDIQENNYIKKFLFVCDYVSLNTTKKYIIPLTMCIGGGGFIQYNHILKNEKLLDKIKLESKDYDISFSFGTNKLNKHVLNDIVNELKTIYTNNIVDFKYDVITKNNFNFNVEFKFDRLHCRIECTLPNKYRFHIAEFSFWFNGKISDNFTINDFIKNKLWIYETNNMIYYLLPLKLLVKTLLYAIVDYFEKRNFDKCIKYIERMKFIKECNKLYMNSNRQNECLSVIFESYKNQIKRKYKMISDYPFLIAYKLKDINNNGIIKCIYRNLRKHNNKYIDTEIEKYKEICKDKKNYNKEFSEITPEDTDDESIIL